MYHVHLLPIVDNGKTEVWISDAAKKALAKFQREGSRDSIHFIKKLQECAFKGFENFHGGVLIAEGEGVFRFGIRDSLFRLIGFYENKSTFIFLEALWKPGHDLSVLNDRCIDRVIVARSKGKVAWSKVDGQ